MGTAAWAHGGYLFVTFKGEQTPMTEQIYFALSPDGRQWTALSNSQPVLVSALGEKGVRDPYLLRSPDGQKFHLIATDLSINRNRDWRRAVRAGSKCIVIWDSTNLVNWSAPRLMKVAPDDAGCTWAPEAVYDESRKEYLVFWASTTATNDYTKHRIWAAWTKDLSRLANPSFTSRSRGRSLTPPSCARMANITASPRMNNIRPSLLRTASTCWARGMKSLISRSPKCAATKARSATSSIRRLPENPRLGV